MEHPKNITYVKPFITEINRTFRKSIIIDGYQSIDRNQMLCLYNESNTFNKTLQRNIRFGMNIASKLNLCWARRKLYIEFKVCSSRFLLKIVHLFLAPPPSVIRNPLYIINPFLIVYPLPPHVFSLKSPSKTNVIKLSGLSCNYVCVVK